MPYLIETASTSSYVNPSSAVIIGANTGDYIEFSGYPSAGNPNGAYRVIGAVSAYENIIEIGSSKVVLRSASGGQSRTSVEFNTGYVQPALGNDFLLRLEKINSNDYEMFLDGVSIGINSSSGHNFTATQFLNFSTRAGDAFQGGCYYIEACTDGTGVATNRWLNTTGTGAVWVDQIGTNDATQGGSWPVDNSEWVFYSTGPVTPINPSITSLLATSARLNWEQG